MLDVRELTERLKAVANADGTVRLEGLKLDALTRDDLERVARGEIEVADVLRRLKARVAAGEFRDTSPSQD